VAAHITERTRAIIPVHLAGLPCDMNSIWEIARRHGLAVIEDAAHAAGSYYDGQPIAAGASSAVAFSFYATKNLTTGEGGMVTTHSQDLADGMRLRCLHGISKGGWDRYSERGNWYYEVLVPGFKYNLTDMQAAIGIHQLRKLEQFIGVRTRYAELYRAILADVEEIELPPDDPRCRHAWHLYMIRLNLDKLEISRDQFILALRGRGIGTSVHFIPIPMHPFFAPFAARPENQCPRAAALYPRLVSIPLYPAMTEAQVEYVAQSVAQIAKGLADYLVKGLA
jgi:dTDP-4-amino-4,6-dideoxygalactose transaminase